MNTITKQTFIDAIRTMFPYLNEQRAKTIIEQIIDINKESIFKRYDIVLPKIGRITTVVKAPRTGRNPKTGEPYPIPALHAVTATRNNRGIRAGKLLRSNIINSLVLYGHSTKDATAYVDIWFSTLALVLTGNYRVELRGLGVFYPRTVKAGDVKRNPATGEPVVIMNDTVHLAFRVAPSLRKAMDKQYLN